MQLNFTNAGGQVNISAQQSDSNVVISVLENGTEVAQDIFMNSLIS